jgi:pimeloyl-ACP methyl ester carboxylesterase
MKRAGAALVACLAAAACGGEARAAASSWVGTFTLPAGTDPVDILVQVHDGRAAVSMGYGHPAHTVVPVAVRGSHVRFALPGKLVFDGTQRGRALVGGVSQGPLRGSFTFRSGTSWSLPLYGLYRSPAGAAVAIERLHGYGAWLVELPSGRVHGIGPSLGVGTLLGDTSDDGSLVPGGGGFTWNGVRYDRVALREREVRVGTTSATLTLPPGAGPFPGVVMVHGSGPSQRDEFSFFAAYLESLGIAVLAGDKRGVGSSTGHYPGSLASDATLTGLAADARAQVRFLAAQPQIDTARVGLWGDSQGGWIDAIAASREHAVRWMISYVGPTVTVGETDTWAGLAGASLSPPSGTRAQMLAQVRALGPRGYDPRPDLAKLDIPAFWAFGADDRNVPTELCVDALEKLRAGHDFAWTVTSSAHTPLELPTGLLSSLPQSRGFVPELFPAVGAWLRSHVLRG